MRINKLDGLRGLFSLMVCVFHYPDDYLPEYISNNFFIVNSDSFVDFFFVLSGFVISYNYYEMRTKKELILYLKKRFVRLYPLLFVTVTVFFVYNISFNVFRGILYNSHPQIFNSFQGFDFSTHIWIPFRKTIDSLLMLNSTPVLGESGGDIGMNGPSWSISSEMISYLFFGTSVILFVKRRLTVILLGIVFSVVTLFFLDEYFLTGDFGFIRGLLSFLVGVCVYLIHINKKIKTNNILEWFGVIFIVLWFYILQITRPGLEMYFPIFTPLVFGIFILNFLNSNGFITKILETRPLQFLGKISYSIYLNHVVLMGIVLSKIPFILPLKENEGLQFIVFIVFLGGLVYVSKYTYNKVEIKGGNYLKKRLL